LIRGGEEGFITKAYNRTDLKIRRRELRSNMPLPEISLWDKLKGRQMAGYKFRRQYSVEAFVMDFYSRELKLAIEIDGDSHFTEAGIAADRDRQAKLESFGICFLRFTNKEVLENLEGVVGRIMEWIGEMTSHKSSP
jgi:very-short-patch-repair endonuclease